MAILKTIFNPYQV